MPLRRLTFLSLLLFTVASPAMAATIMWSGAANSDWQTASNWVGGVIPDGDDIAHIAIANGPVINGITPSPVIQLRASNLTIQSGGKLSSTGVSNIGYLGHGTVLVDGAGSELNGITGLIIGNDSNAVLTVQNGGLASSAGNTIIGNTATSVSSATVRGVGSSLAGNALYVGYNGNGSLTILSGATAASTTTTYIGLGLGSVGTANVTGAGSKLNSGGELRVGNNGTGTLTVEDGGEIASTGLFIVGYAAGSNGTVTVSEAGSKLVTSALRVGELGTGTMTVQESGEVTVGGAFNIGRLNGSNGTMSILSGGKVSNTGLGYIGANAGSVGAVTVGGVGSTWTSATSLYLGSGGTGTLTIEHGGSVSNASSAIVGVSTGSIGTATVKGAGSTWTNSSHLYIGNNGTGAMTVEDGGAVTSGNYVYIGMNAGSIGTATVKGAGSSLNGSVLAVGNSGNGALTIESGATAASVGPSHIGVNAGSTGSATITGAGSKLTSGGELRVGVSGQGNLTVEDGSEVSSTGIIYLGWGASGTGTATVRGTSSKLASGGELRVGNTGAGTLTIENAGSATAATHIQIGVNASGSTVATGANSSIAANNFFYVGRNSQGELKVQGGAAARSGWSTRIGYDANGVGKVLVEGTGSLLDTQADLQVGRSGAGTLTVSDSGRAKVAGTLQIAQNVGSTGTVNIGSGSGDAAVAAGVIEAPLIQFGAGTGRLVFNHTDANYVLSSNISGAGTMDFLSGTSVLTGNNTGFTGSVNVDGGILRVNGAMGATSTSVGSGARFEGNASIGSLTVNSGGTLAPGNSIGTTNVVNATFNPGSDYEVELNSAMQSDLLAASGTVTINGGTVHAIPYPDYLVGTPYTIITAAGGVGGAGFDALINPAFLIGNLIYNPNSVQLLLSAVPGALEGAADTRNQRAVARVAERVGGNAAVSALLASPSNEEARAGMDLLSGEIHASLSAAQMDEQRHIRDIALKRRPNVEKAYGEGTVWMSAYGGRGTHDSDGNAAGMKERAGGVLVGVKYALEDGYLGAAIGFGRSHVDVDGRASDATSEDYTLLAYGGHELNGTGLSLDGGASWTLHAIDTQRDIDIGTFSGRSEAEYDAQSAQFFARLAQRLDAGDIRLTPYGEAAYVYHRAQGFEEDGAAGLKGRASTNHTGYTTLGAEVAHDIALDERTLSLEAGAGWRHALGDTEVTHGLSFRDAAGSDFTVEGTPLARDALILDAGLSFDFAPGVNASLHYGGTVAEDARAHTLSARAGLSF